MPMYEYVADRCDKHPACSRRMEYLQSMSERPLAACRDCGVPIRKILSSFAARSGEAGLSSPDPTPLNVTGMSPPQGMIKDAGGEGGCSHSHE